MNFCRAAASFAADIGSPDLTRTTKSRLRSAINFFCWSVSGTSRCCVVISGPSQIWESSNRIAGVSSLRAFS